MPLNVNPFDYVVAAPRPSTSTLDGDVVVRIRALAMLAYVALAVLALGCGADGLNEQDSLSYFPPDVQGAVGPNHVLEAVNNQVRIWSRSNFSVVTSYSLTSLWGGACNETSDPRVRYDSLSGRWFISAVKADFYQPGAWCLAVSGANTDPFLWHTYVFTSPDSVFNVSGNVVTAHTFPDQPGLGISEDKVVLSGDLAGAPPGASNLEYATVERSAILVLSKAELLAGATPYMQLFAPVYDTTHRFFIRPSFNLSPSGGTIYMAGVNALANPGTNLRLYTITGIPGNGTTSSLTLYVFSPTYSFVQPPPAPQKGEAQLDTNDDRVLDVVYRDGAMWIASNHGCIPTGDSVLRACARFMHITTNPLLLDQDAKVKAVNLNYFYPGISIDAAENLITVVDRSTATEFPSVWVSGRRPTDPVNTMRAPVQIRAGQTPCCQIRPGETFCAWGDYSAAAHDPVQELDTWVGAEYPVGLTEWGTWGEWLQHTQYPQ